jgi:WD40 repeat protein
MTHRRTSFILQPLGLLAAALLSAGPAPAEEALKERAVFKAHELDVRGLAFSPDGKTLATCGGNDHTVRLWDVATGKQLAELKHPDDAHPIACVAFSPDGKRLASSGTAVRLRDVATRKATAASKGGGGNCVAFSPDGKTLAADDGGLKLLDGATLDQRAELKGAGINTTAVAFSPDGKRLYAGGVDDPLLCSWDVATGKPAGSAKVGHSVSAVALSRDGKFIAMGNDTDWGEGGVKVWSLALEKGAPILAKHLVQKDAAASVAFSPDGKTLFLSLQGEARLFDLAGGKPLRQVGGKEEGFLRAGVFSPDGKVLATGDPAGQVKLWDVPAR